MCRKRKAEQVLAAAAVRAEKAVAAAAAQAEALAAKVAEAQRLVAMQDRWVLCLPSGHWRREIPLVWQGWFSKVTVLTTRVIFSQQEQ